MGRKRSTMKKSHGLVLAKAAEARAAKTVSAIEHVNVSLRCDNEWYRERIDQLTDEREKLVHELADTKEHLHVALTARNNYRHDLGREKQELRDELDLALAANKQLASQLRTQEQQVEELQTKLKGFESVAFAAVAARLLGDKSLIEAPAPPKEPEPEKLYNGYKSQACGNCVSGGGREIYCCSHCNPE